MSVKIYGAGMAGLLTASMLRRLNPTVYEAQEALPDNHGALLRFRSTAVQKATNIPFHKVRVLKGIMSNGRICPVCTLADANEYAWKVHRAVLGVRSVLNLEPCERYIAPDDFLAVLARDARLITGAPLTLEQLKSNRDNGHVTISTIPMPVLMNMVGYQYDAFQAVSIWSVIVELPTELFDVYQTIYYPSLDVPYYRASITGRRIIIEYTQEPNSANWRTNDAQAVLSDFGIPASSIAFTVSEPKWQKYGKLVPIPDAVRQTFILAMTDQYNCYSVGRFATWRQILLDDVVHDVERVETWITQRNSYLRRRDQ